MKKIEYHPDQIAEELKKMHKSNHSTKKVWMAMSLALLVMTGCAVGPDFKSPEAPQTQAYTETALPEKTIETKGPGGNAQRFVTGEDIPAC